MNIDLKALSDAELREMLDLPGDVKPGLRHYFSKDDKIRWLGEDLSEAERDSILAAARAKQVEHHRYLKSRRAEGYPNKQVRIEQKMGDQMWRFITTETEPFKDQVTGRKARIGYIIESVTTGERLKVTKSTLLDAHDRLGLIQGWPPPKSRVAAPEAASAGLVTGANLRSAIGNLRSVR